MASFEVIDYVFIGVSLALAVWGAFKGFIEEIAQKSGYVFGLVLGLMFTVPLSQLLCDVMPLWLASFLCYFILFICGYLLVKAFGAVMQSICEESNITVIDHILGFMLGLFEGIIIISFAESLLQYQTLFDIDGILKDSWVNNNIIYPVMDFISSLI